MRPEAAGIARRLLVASEVADALRDGRPVVALESSLVSHGLPYPRNIEVARAAEAAVRASGALPATVGINDGRLLVGLDDAALEALATAPPGQVAKASRHSLAAALVGGGWAATTVSATLIVAHAAGIGVFATGGIGGVHRGALGGATFDVSADLDELASTPMAVVCAGPKAIVDVAATLEYLETRGVPVLTIGQGELPGFWSRSAGICSPLTVTGVEAAAAIVRTHIEIDLGGGILVCVPVPEADGLDGTIAGDAIDQAVDEAAAAGIRGPDLSPWLLARVGEFTRGASIRANAALIVNDARVAAELAVALASG